MAVLEGFGVETLLRAVKAPGQTPAGDSPLSPAWLLPQGTHVPTL